MSRKRPYITVVANQKGGSGKSVFSVNIAVELSYKREEYTSLFRKKVKLTPSIPVLAIGLDPQNSLDSFNEMREIPNPHFVSASYNELKPIIEEATEKGYVHIVIDTPPHAHVANMDVLHVADLIVIPSKQGLFDADALNNDNVTNIILKKNHLFVPNMVRNAARAEDLRNYIQNSLEGSQVSKTSVGLRTAFEDALLEGKSIAEFSPESEPGVQEIRELMKEIKRKLKNGS